MVFPWTHTLKATGAVQTVEVEKLSAWLNSLQFFQKAAAYRMCGQKYLKARGEKLIVKREWDKKHLSFPFTCGCDDLEVRKSLSGTGWGTCKAWLRFSLPVVPQSLQCLPWCIRLQAALFSPFLALERNNLLKEHFGYPCIFPRPPFFLEASWPLGLHFSTNTKKNYST